MAIRDYLNVEDKSNLRDFVLQNCQAVAIVKMDEENPIPLETWYFDANSMSVDNDNTVIRPYEILENEPGRYIKSMTSSDWNFTLNKPNFADVAISGSYNDLINKLTAGDGILINSNAVSVDNTQFMSISQATTEINTMQNSINGKAPQARILTINGISQDLSSNRSWQVGNVSTDQLYNNPAWITSLAVSKVTGLATVATTGSYLDLVNKPSLSTVAISGSYNDLINKPTIPSAQVNSDWASVSGVSQILNKPTIPSNTSQITESGNLYFTNARAQGAISLTTTGTSGAATYSAGVLNIPVYSGVTPSFTNTAVKTLNGAGVQLSTTRASSVSYTVTHTIALTLVILNGSSNVYLEISPNNSTWTTISQTGYSDGVGVAVAITKSTVGNIQGMVPAGWYVRLRSVVTGGGTSNYTWGQEVQIN